MNKHVEATKYLKETFDNDELESFFLAGASDFLMDKLADNMKAVDTQEPFKYEPLDHYRYLLLARAALTYLQGKAYRS